MSNEPSKLTIFGIVDNIASIHSKGLLEKHLSHPDFEATWNTYMVLRFLSAYDNVGKIAEMVPAFEKVQDGKLLYRLLFTSLATQGRLQRGGQYEKSPFKT